MPRITKKFLREICTLNPSPWDPERFMLRYPTYGQLLAFPDEFEGTLDMVDLGEGWPDQGNWGKCVGWSVSEAMEITDFLLDNEPEDLSAEDAYNKARKYDGLPDFLEGSNNLGAMKGLQKLGICNESCWPTSIDKATPSPGLQCTEEVYEAQSTLHGIDQYYQVPLSVGGFKAALYGATSDPQWGEGVGVPLIIGFRVPESLVDAVDGVCPIPLPGEGSLGGHSALVTGYDLIDDHLYFTNPETWGKDKGADGVYKLPVEYLTGGWIMDAWCFHNGPPIGGTDSDCVLGRSIASILSGTAAAFGRRGRFKYYNP